MTKKINRATCGIIVLAVVIVINIITIIIINIITTMCTEVFLFFRGEEICHVVNVVRISLHVWEREKGKVIWLCFILTFRFLLFLCFKTFLVCPFFLNVHWVLCGQKWLKPFALAFKKKKQTKQNEREKEKNPMSWQLLKWNYGFKPHRAPPSVQDPPPRGGGRWAALHSSARLCKSLGLALTGSCHKHFLWRAAALERPLVSSGPSALASWHTTMLLASPCCRSCCPTSVLSTHSLDRVCRDGTLDKENDFSSTVKLHGCGL